MIIGLLLVFLLVFFSDYSKTLSISVGQNSTDSMGSTDGSNLSYTIETQYMQHRNENSKSLYNILLAGPKRRYKRQAEKPEHEENMQKFASVATMTIQRSVHMIYSVLKDFYDAVAYPRGWGGKPLAIDITQPVWYIKHKLWSYIRPEAHAEIVKPTSK